MGFTGDMIGHDDVNIMYGYIFWSHKVTGIYITNFYM